MLHPTSEDNKYRGFLFVVILLIFISPIINNVISPRLAFNTEINKVDIFAKDPFIYWIRFTLTVTVLSLSGFLMYPALKQKFSKVHKQLWIAVMFFTMGPILAMFFGTARYFDVQCLIIISCMTALFLLKREDFNWYVGLGRFISLVYIYGSLIAAYFFPSIAIEDNYTQGLLFSFRLHGIANLANHLAPMVLIFWLCDRLLKKKLNLLNLFNYLLSFVVLVLTQSKTTWLAILIILIITYTVKLSSYKRMVFIPFGGALCILLLVFFADSIQSHASVFTDQDIDFITSLSGRNMVWDFTIKLWQANPWFGYGMGIWRDKTVTDFMSLYNWTPGQAHNQFFQTLGNSGIFGVVGLIYYLFTLIILGVRYSNKNNMAVIILVTLIIIRGITESDLISNIFHEHFIIQVFTFGLLVIKSRDVIKNGELKNSMPALES